MSQTIDGRNLSLKSITQIRTELKCLHWHVWDELSPLLNGFEFVLEQ